MRQEQGGRGQRNSMVPPTLRSARRARAQSDSLVTSPPSSRSMWWSSRACSSYSPSPSSTSRTTSMYETTRITALTKLPSRCASIHTAIRSMLLCTHQSSITKERFGSSSTCERARGAHTAATVGGGAPRGTRTRAAGPVRVALGLAPARADEAARERRAGAGGATPRGAARGGRSHGRPPRAPPTSCAASARTASGRRCGSP